MQEVCMKPSVYGKRQLSEIIELPTWNTSQTRRVIKALEDSGMSVAKFCGLHGLNYWRVMNAKRRLMKAASNDLKLDRLYVIYPETSAYPLAERIEVVPVHPARSCYQG
jgi:hypothetical protein